MVLERLVFDRVMRLASLSVVPVTAAGERFRVVAGCEPLLRLVSEVEVVGSAGSAHAGRYPARIDGVAAHVRVQTGHGGGECRDEQLAVLVRACPMPAPI